MPRPSRPLVDGKYQCSKCNLWKVPEDFTKWYSKKREQIVRTCHCKVCRRPTKEQTAIRYSRPEARARQIQQSLAWIRNNPDKYRVIAKKYRDRKAIEKKIDAATKPVA